jgi:hypothetical protein
MIQASACLKSNDTLCNEVLIAIVVLDINDNSPIFDRDIYEARITIDIPIGSPVLRVRASDRDSGHNAMISYALKTQTGK